jgi:peptide/nickel transport system permease protein
MVAYIVKRTLLAAFTIWVITFIAFFVAQMPPGDAVDQYVGRVAGGEERGRTIEEMEALRELWGLNKPVVYQYWDWLTGIISDGDFGYSYTFLNAEVRYGGGPIAKVIKERLPYTIYLAAFTIAVTWTLAIPVGIYSAVRQHSVGDYVFTALGFTGLAVPDFLLGLVLMYVFFAYFDQSVGGMFSGDYQQAPWDMGKVIDMLKHLIIPGVVLGTSGTAGLIRVMRNNLLDELRKPYVVTARAKGLPGWRTVVKYPVRVAINPFISGIGSMLPALVSGSVIVAVVLGLPTLGPLLLQALQFEDVPMIAAIIMLLAMMTVIGTLISDLLLVVVDPRIKLTGSGRSGG